MNELLLKPKRKQRYVSPKDRGVNLTPRDIEALYVTWRYGIIRERTLFALVYAAEKSDDLDLRAKQRMEGLSDQKKMQGLVLRLFRNEGKPLIGRYEPLSEAIASTRVVRYRKHPKEFAYYLTRAGVAELNTKIREGWIQDKIHPQHVGLEFPYSENHEKRTSWNTLHHFLDVGEFHACVELALRESPTTEIRLWLNEYDKGPDGKPILYDRVNVPREREHKVVKPDAAFVLTDTESGLSDLLMVEIDQGNESRVKRWRDKIIAYRNYMSSKGYKEKWGEFKGFRVLTVCRDRIGRKIVNVDPKADDAIQRTQKLIEEAKNDDWRRQRERKINLIQGTYALGSGKPLRQFLFCTFADLMPGNRPCKDHLFDSPIWHHAVRLKEKKDLDKESPLTLGENICDRDFQKAQEG